MKRKLELWLEIHELTEQGEYAPVEVVPRGDVGTGGVFQLRQGQQRRLVVRVAPVIRSGTLPLICQHIGSVAVGAVCIRSRLQRPLDSYQVRPSFSFTSSRACVFQFWPALKPFSKLEGDLRWSPSNLAVYLAVCSEYWNTQRVHMLMFVKLSSDYRHGHKSLT